MKRILLLDVDGTLVTNSAPTHLQATVGAIRDVFGFNVEVTVEGDAHFLNGRHIDGLTIAAITRDALLHFGVAEADILKSLPEIEDVSAVKYQELLDGGAHPGDLINGVADTLDALMHQDVTMGLLTGGTKVLVELKLRAVGLANYFAFGGYGGTSYDRYDLFGLALEDLRRTQGSLPAGLAMVYVGDTLFDVEAGHRAGATVVAVASGSCAAETLANAGADHVFQDLGAAKSQLLDLVAG